MSTIYLDMDGVVADFDKAILSHYPDLKNEAIPYHLREEIVEAICRKKQNFFQHLPPIEGAIESIKKLISLNKFDIYFLSTPMWSVPESFTDKRVWLENHYGDLVKKRLILSHRKDLQIGHFLIDDRIKNGVENFKGIHIHFGTDPNFLTWQQTYSYLKDLS